MCKNLLCWVFAIVPMPSARYITDPLPGLTVILSIDRAEYAICYSGIYQALTINLVKSFPDFSLVTERNLESHDFLYGFPFSALRVQPPFTVDDHIYAFSEVEDAGIIWV